MPVEIEEEDYSPCDLQSPPEAKAETVTLKVPVSLSGSRLDQVLVEMLPEFSRSRLAALAKAGNVTVDGILGLPKTKLFGGEEIQATLMPREAEMAFLPEDLPLNVLFEDDALLVIDKQAGLVVHPGAGNWSGTLLNALLFRNPTVAELPRAGIVHRLDKETSGVMVVAKTEAAQLSLVRQLQSRTVKRIYVALVRGHPPQDGVVEKPIGRHPHHRTKMAVVGEDEGQGGKIAVTHFRLVQRFPHHSLLECQLETGRTHQIRVHMQSIGFPIEGDQVYSPGAVGVNAATRDVFRRFGRQALHARKLTFDHPVHGESVTFEAPVPADMRELIDVVAAL
ncbi:MAG: RluA family pseudouridine synthase [Betaproteobacteria bacterium]